MYFTLIYYSVLYEFKAIRGPKVIPPLVCFFYTDRHEANNHYFMNINDLVSNNIETLMWVCNIFSWFQYFYNTITFYIDFRCREWSKQLDLVNGINLGLEFCEHDLKHMWKHIILFSKLLFEVTYSFFQSYFRLSF